MVNSTRHSYSVIKVPRDRKKMAWWEERVVKAVKGGYRYAL